MPLGKKDFLYIALISLLLLFVIKLNYYMFGNILYDCGRELFIPSMINEGYVPLKDIFLSYFPLSYQINAFIFKIFNNSIDTLRITGAICSLLIGGFIYLSSRIFEDEKNSFKITVIVTFITMFNVSFLFNYIFAYSYAFIYAITILFISLFFALKYIKEDKFLYIFAFLFGVLPALKLELAFLFIPFLILLFYKKTKLKQVLVSLFLYILPLFLSFLVLFIKGFNFIDLKNYLIFLTGFLKSPILKFYNSQIFALKPLDWLIVNLKSFLKFAFGLFITYLFLYFPHSKEKRVLYNILTTVLFVVFFFITLFMGHFSAGELFSWLCISSLFMLIFELKKNKNFSLVFLFLIQLFLAFRFNFIYQGGYIAYILPVALFANCLYLIRFKSKIFITYLLLIAVLNVTYFTLAQKILVTKNIETKFGKVFFEDEKTAAAIKETVDYLSNIPDDKTVLVLPDGAIFNYLTNKKTNLKYYQLLPNHIEVLGEENIVSDLEKNPVNYILIMNTDYSIYGTPEFCKDFGLKICKFTYENYEFVNEIKKDEKNLGVKIYKIKQSLK